MGKGRQNKYIHIVHIHEKFYPHMGGSTFRLLNLLNGVAKQNPNFKFTVLCENHTKNLLSEETLSSNVNIIRFKSYFLIPFLLFNLARQKRIDILHAHNYRPLFFTFLSNFFLRKPLVVEMHYVYKTSFLKQIIVNILFKLMQKNEIITISEKSKKYLSKIYKIPEERIKVVYNGIDLDFFKNFHTIPKPDDYQRIFKFISKFKLKIGYIGSFYDWQGIFNFVEVARRVVEERKDRGFIMIGDGPEFLKIKKLIEKYSLEKNILVHSSVSQDKIPLFYNLIDILLLPRPSTLATETAIPLKPIEALACKKIIVSTKVGGLSELKEKITDGIFLFDQVEEIVTFLKEFDTKKYKLEKIPEKLNIFSDLYQSKNLIDIYHGLTKEN